MASASSSWMFVHASATSGAWYGVPQALPFRAMAFLRRRKKEQESQPWQSDPANQVPGATRPDQWRPKSVSQALPALKEPTGRGDSWVPDGVVPPPPGQRHARSSASIEIPPEMRAATAPAPPPPVVDQAPAPAPPQEKL